MELTIRAADHSSALANTWVWETPQLPEQAMTWAAAAAIRICGPVCGAAAACSSHFTERCARRTCAVVARAYCSRVCHAAFFWCFFTVDRGRARKLAILGLMTSFRSLRVCVTGCALDAVDHRTNATRLASPCNLRRSGRLCATTPRSLRAHPLAHIEQPCMAHDEKGAATKPFRPAGSSIRGRKAAEARAPPPSRRLPPAFRAQRTLSNHMHGRSVMLPLLSKCCRRVWRGVRAASGSNHNNGSSSGHGCVSGSRALEGRFPGRVHTEQQAGRITDSALGSGERAGGSGWANQ